MPAATWPTANYRALTEFQEFLCLHSLASPSSLVVQKKMKFTNISEERAGRGGRRDPLTINTESKQDVSSSVLLQTQTNCPKLPGQIPQGSCSLQQIGVRLRDRGFKLSLQGNNRSYIIFINIHHFNCLILPQNKVTL